MKYLLVNDRTMIVYISDTIDYHENGNIIVDNGALSFIKSIVDEVVEIDDTQVTIPEDFVPYKYMYVDGGIVSNPDYVKPEPPMDEKVEINKLKEVTASLESQMTDAQLALCETYESSETQLTDLQMAVAEIYELILSMQETASE